ncbi:MAG TPA: response regulator [Gemmatimonadaceae bacterium]|jgi:DNA-binding response OmpR family regulator|nr:response regulator [Gemmatimonadaceae bacterium]
MTSINSPQRTALVGFSDEWMRRSMETVFQEKGYKVVRTGSGKEALGLARRGGFDVLMLDERIEQLSGVDVCIALRDDPLFDHATPIVIVSSAHSSLPSRTAAYAAGAWEYCHQPVDVDGLFLKLSTFLRARRELAEHQAKSLMDPSSGLYTEFGLQQLAEQLEARAVRNHEAFACLAFSPEPQSRGPGDRSNETVSTTFRDFANLVREQARRSDVIATRGETQLAVLAPDTDAAGAKLLVARLQRELQASRRGAAANVQLRAGYCAVSDLAAAKVDVNELVHRAESALAHVGSVGTPESVMSFDDLPV